MPWKSICPNMGSHDLGGHGRSWEQSWEQCFLRVFLVNAESLETHLPSGAVGLQCMMPYTLAMLPHRPAAG